MDGVTFTHSAPAVWTRLNSTNTAKSISTPTPTPRPARAKIWDTTPSLRGPSAGWTRFTAKTHGNDAYMTYAIPGQRQENYAIFDMGNSDRGNYKVQVYVPGTRSWAKVNYEIWVNHRKVKTVQINQANHFGWVTLGTIRGGGKMEIVVRDNRAWPYLAGIGVDATRALPV